MRLETDPAVIAREGAESDARVLASRLRKAVDALEALNFGGTAAVLKSNPAAAIGVAMDTVKRHRSTLLHGSPEHVAANSARRALAELWEVLP